MIAYFAAWFITRHERAVTIQRLMRDNARLTYERDDALSLVADLQLDLEAAERLRRVLMQACPSDARELTP